MDLTDCVYGRRAVREYAPRQVDPELVRRLVRAATHAPSAMNAQPWLFAVVQDRARLQDYSERAKAMLLETRGHDAKLRHYEMLLRDPRFNIFYDAGTLVTIGEAPRDTYTDANCWLAAAAFMLAAYDAGLGTCPIGFAVPVLNTPAMKKELGYPSDAVVVAPIIVGYPHTTPPPVPRRDPRIVGWLA